MNAYCISNYQSNVPQDRLIITLTNGDKQELDVSSEGYSSDLLKHLTRRVNIEAQHSAFSRAINRTVSLGLYMFIKSDVSS